MPASSGSGGRLFGAPPPDESEDQEQLAEIDARLARVREEKLASLEDPGPSWKEWFYFQATKWWIGIGLIVVDSWIVGYWLEEGSVPALVGTLALALYAEFLLTRYLWHRPDDARGLSVGRFHPTWLQPVEFGRWTPEGFRVRAGLSPQTGEAPARGEEFL
jgi:hypothetical protein